MSVTISAACDVNYSCETIHLLSGRLNLEVWSVFLLLLLVSGGLWPLGPLFFNFVIFLIMRTLLSSVTKIFKRFDKKVLSQTKAAPKKRKQYDPKGNVVPEFSHGEQNILETYMDYTADTLEDHVPKMQKRSIRMKNLFYMSLFLMWYIGVGLFIMYRVRGDDLDELEKEAMEKVRLSKLHKEFEK